MRWGLLVAVAGVIVLLGAPVVHHDAATWCPDRVHDVPLLTRLGPTPPTWQPGTASTIPGFLCHDVEAHRSSPLTFAKDASPVAWGPTVATAVTALLLVACMAGAASLGNGGASPRRPRAEWTVGRVAFALLATLPAVVPLYSAGDMHELLERPNDDDVTFVVVPLLPFAIADDLVQEALLTLLDAAGPGYGLDPEWWATAGRGEVGERAKVVPAYAGLLGTPLTVAACFLMWVAAQPHLMRAARAIGAWARRPRAAHPQA